MSLVYNDVSDYHTIKGKLHRSVNILHVHKCGMSSEIYLVNFQN